MAAELTDEKHSIRMTADEVDIRGEEYLILRERDVHAVASARAEGQSGLYL